MSPGRFVGRTRRLCCLVSALIWGIVLGCSSAAQAGSIVQFGGAAGTSLQGLGSFSGSIEYSTASALSTTGTLIITLTNTSDAANGGYISGLLFNPEGSIDGAADAHPFINCAGGGLNGEPVGKFDAGAAIGGDFTGGGSGVDPNPGIAVGRSGIFTFNITAADAGSLAAIDFLNSGEFDFNFLVRFKGFEDGGSDNIGAVVVPLPISLALGVIGLGCLAIARWLTHRTHANADKSVAVNVTS